LPGPHVGCTVHVPPTGPGVQVSPDGAQSRHCWPNSPHWFVPVPGRQALPWQHPEQLPGPHVGTLVQKPPTIGVCWHCSPKLWQSWHCWPNTPQAVLLLPVMQTFPSQQPEQLPGPHVVVGEQKPPGALHTSPESAQFWHCWPALPQKFSAIPLRQVLPSQHPEQLPGPHPVCGMHIPPVPAVPQVSPRFWQLMHCCPRDPHAVGKAPGSQRFPKQQPEHVVGPHVGWVHEPPLQTWPSTVQLKHPSPATPHAVDWSPATHMSPTQHPLQFVGPQPGVSIMHMCEAGSQMLKPSLRQFWQEKPPVPHDWVENPGWQLPKVSQHPKGQLNGLQLPASDASSPSGDESSPVTSSPGPPSPCATT
jgi:hypothetical protein